MTHPVTHQLELTDNQAELVDLLRGRRTLEQYVLGLLYADARRRAGVTATRHHYVSTACSHDVHLKCQRVCGFCTQRCLCTCHRQAPHRVPRNA